MEKNEGYSPLSVLDQMNQAFLTRKVLQTKRAQAIKNGTNGNNDFDLWTVDIQPTSECTQKCIHCSNMKRNESRNSLSEDILRQVIEDCNKLNAKGIIYSGGGEPLAWRNNSLASFIKNNPSDAKLALVTNGTLFNHVLDEEILDLFFFIEFSINSHTAELYNKVADPIENYFDATEKYMIQGVNIKKARNLTTPVINGKLVINKVNFKEAPEIHKYIRSFGFDNVFLRMCNNFEEGQDFELSKAQEEELKDILHSRLEVEDRSNVIRMIMKHEEQKSACNCWTVNLNHNAIIATDGSVYICSPSQGNPKYSIGNVNEDRLINIWNSERHKEVKRILNEDMLKGLCNLNACRHNKFNHLMQDYISGVVEYEVDESKFHEQHACFL